jgi:polar amino acid transport system permease protein
LSAIALPELTGTATVINSRTLLYVQTFAVVLVAYLVLSNVLSWIASQLGARMFHPPLIVRPGARWVGFTLRRANRA